jgi:cytidyltransferase-like protein
METSPNVSLKEILSPRCPPERRFIRDLQHVALLAKQAKDTGHTVVIVGGVWDLPHIGHAKYLRLAKEEGDLLIVVVDSDELVRDRKGPTRPVVPEAERVQMVCHLASADIVILRDLREHLEDKEYLNKVLKPNVCVLSTGTGDISEAQYAVIAQYVDRIKVFLPQAETSSSARIRLLAIDGATPLAKAVTDLVDVKAKQVADILSTMPAELQVLIESHMNKLKEL